MARTVKILNSRAHLIVHDHRIAVIECKQAPGAHARELQTQSVVEGAALRANNHGQNVVSHSWSGPIASPRRVDSIRALS
ncbi:hypothetical protein K438DRAFT_1850625 [Mycena galopus ATCC 62051]|nr:hypothetical protein K438DRAFT_1850625 [Mycena galopus ATCC 62051]